MANDPHRVSLEVALEMVARAQQAKLLPVKGWSIDGGIIREILAQPGAARLRVYLAAGVDGLPTLVFLAADAESKDLSTGVIAEYSIPCPPLCDPDSPFLRSE